MTYLLAALFLVTPADTLHLEACLHEARLHHPLYPELALQEAVGALKIENLNVHYLPALSFGGQATYQSEVADLPLSLPGATVPQVAQDQYRLSLTVDQLIYDAGLTTQQKNVERIQTDLAMRQVDVELYNVREHVQEAYFGVLRHEARLELLRVLETDLEARLRVLEARLRAGVVTSGDVDVLQVELARVAQEKVEVRTGRRAALDVLAELIGRPLEDDVVLALPAVELEAVRTDAGRRPEFDVFALSRERLAQQEALTARRNRPRLAAYVEAAYGRPPGLNLFTNDFQPFFSVGLRATWKAWDWNATQREREVLALQRRVIDGHEEAFARSVSIAARRALRDIERLEALIRQDEEIIRLRERIAAEAASRLENGVITASDYLIERNAAHQARLARERRRIELVQAKIAYLTTIGVEQWGRYQ